MDFQRLTRPGEPWLHLLIEPTPATLAAIRRLEYAAPPRPTVRCIRGWKSTTVLDFYNEMAAALQFPEYFGENWDALYDSLCDLPWLAGDGCVLLILSAERLLADASDDQFRTLVTVVGDAARQWGCSPEGGPRVPFHVVLSTSAIDQFAVRGRWQAAGAVVSRLT
jgi:Barstar (barnase inhibitor)